MVNAHLRATARGRGSAGRASPCQGEGRGFESRRPLGRRPGNRPDFLGGVAERRGNGLQIRVRGFKSRRHLETLLGPLAQWLARFLDTEEVTGSIPVWSTSKTPVFGGFRISGGVHQTRVPQHLPRTPPNYGPQNRDLSPRQPPSETNPNHQQKPAKNTQNRDPPALSWPSRGNFCSLGGGINQGG